MPFVGFVVNKVHLSRPVGGGAAPAQIQAQIEEALATHPAVAQLALSGTTRTMAAQALIAAHGEIETLAAADRRAIARLAAAGGPETLLIEVPLLRDDVHDVDRLVGLERYLLGEAPDLPAAASR